MQNLRKTGNNFARCWLPDLDLVELKASRYLGLVMTKTRFKLGVTCVIGFLVGLLASKTYFESSYYRAARMVRLFEYTCFGDFDWQEATNYSLFSSLQLDETGGKHTSPKGTVKFFDPVGKFTLSRRQNDCLVLTHPTFPSNANEAKQVMNFLPAIKEKYHPELPRDKGIDGVGPFAVGWMIGPSGHESRWGIAFIGFVEGENSYSLYLSYSSPPA